MVQKGPKGLKGHAITGIRTRNLFALLNFSTISKRWWSSWRRTSGPTSSANNKAERFRTVRYHLKRCPALLVEHTEPRIAGPMAAFLKI